MTIDGKTGATGRNRAPDPMSGRNGSASDGPAMDPPAADLVETPWFYLFYLLFYFSSWFLVAPDRADVIAGVLGVLIFAPVYLLTWGKGLLRVGFGAAVALALAIGLAPFNGMSGTYGIFAVTLCASLRPPKRAYAAMSVTGAIYFAGSALREVGPFEIAMTLFIGAMAGIATLSGASLAERSHLRERALRLEAALAEVRERERIARDLHDLLGHTLTSIAVKSDLAGRLLDADPPAARREVDDIGRAARGSLAEVRAAVTGMNRTTLAKEIERAEAACDAAGIALEVRGAASGLDPSTDTAAGLALREAVTNIVRHAGATRAVIVLSDGPAQVTVAVEDDGRGGIEREGEGLTGMRRRLEAVGGTLSIEARPRGVGLRITVPSLGAGGPLGPAAASPAPAAGLRSREVAS